MEISTLEISTLRANLDRDFRLLRAAVASCEPAAKVPTCPEWTADRLARHVAQTYLHKVECIRLGVFPEAWPPPGPDPEPDALRVLDEQYAALRASFDAHEPQDPAATWHRPDQTVGFWIRRMAHETAVHRVDAELTAGLATSAIPAELALDGIEEFLALFIGYLSAEYPEEYGPVLGDPDPRPLVVRAGGRSWTMRCTPDGVEVARAEGPGDPAAALVVAGEPADVLLWLWGRAEDRVVAVEGDYSALNQMLELRKGATQ